jgi:methyl-accepting chemotaxis protein
MRFHSAAADAARPGGPGGGFAEAADEVRNLAMRAADAAKNTAGPDRRVVSRTKHGLELVEKTDKGCRQLAEYGNYLPVHITQKSISFSLD